VGPPPAAPAAGPSGDEKSSLRRRLAEYETLLEIGVELAGTLELARVLELALIKAEELCSAESSSIWELDDESNELFFRVVRGRAAGDIRGLRVPVGVGIVGSVARSGRAEIVNDVREDPRWRGDTGSDFVTRAILTVPLVAHGRVVGVLQLLNPVGRQGFTSDDLRRMRLFAGPLANAVENARLYAAQKRVFVDTVTALAEAIEKRDPYTGGHVRRVVSYSLLLGAELGLPPHELEALRLAATLHDVGKIAVPDTILRKPAPLDREEVVAMQRHPLDGAEIVSRIRDLRHLLPGVRSHHERVDGGGYPDGLGGEDIPLVARIIAVADTYDAMTTNRPYRQGLTPERAAAEIRRGRGSQFAPEVVAAFEAAYERGAFTLEQGEAILVSLSEAIERG
jgi:HD-GYP domain-containing protein (c-di-GMP phosphodiesterase class II)